MELVMFDCNVQVFDHLAMGGEDCMVFFAFLMRQIILLKTHNKNHTKVCYFVSLRLFTVHPDKGRCFIYQNSPKKKDYGNGQMDTQI